MRVMLLVTDLQRGGTPLRIARLARGLRDAGLDVHVGCLAPRGPISGDLESTGMATFACDARHPRDVSALWRLACHVKRIKPDLIHSTLTHANVAARLVGLWRRIPVLSSTATIEVERQWHVWAERLTARLDRGHIVNSRALAEHVARTFRLPWARIHVIPPSIGEIPRRIDRHEARCQLGIAEHEFVVLWVGRFDPVKRLDIAIGCAEILSAVPSRLLLVGEGSYGPTVERMVQLSSVARIIHLLGWRDDLGPLMSAADAFLFPSLTEGMPNAVLEAMAFGLPVVASDIPAMHELAWEYPDDGNASPDRLAAEDALDLARMILIHQARPKLYAEALLHLRNNAERARLIGRNAAAWARAHLAPDKTFTALTAAYSRVLKSRGVPALPS